MTKGHCKLATFPILIHKEGKENARYILKALAMPATLNGKHRENPSKWSSNMADGKSRVTCPHTHYSYRVQRGKVLSFVYDPYML